MQSNHLIEQTESLSQQSQDTWKTRDSSTNNNFPFPVSNMKISAEKMILVAIFGVIYSANITMSFPTQVLYNVDICY